MTLPVLAEPAVIEIDIRSASGERVELPGAVVSALAVPSENSLDTPLEKPSQNSAELTTQIIETHRSRRKIAEMAQINRQFNPFVLAVEKGVAVAFPNRDKIAHHVYSFSSTKSFELPLYKGSASQPIIFPKPGLVPLGCNIHDWMIGFVVVLDTPYFQQFESEKLMFPSPPPGRYQFNLYHPSISDKEEVGRILLLTSGPERDSKLSFQLKYTLQDIEQPVAPQLGFDEEDEY